MGWSTHMQDYMRFVFGQRVCTVAQSLVGPCQGICAVSNTNILVS